MKFTAAERLILVEQFEILSLLKPSEAAHYHAMSEILRRGYEGLYPIVAGEVTEPPMSVHECKQVADTLEMFRVMRASYRRLEDKTGIDERELRFAGFDAVAEPRQFHLAKLLLDVQARFADLRGDASDHDGPPGNLETYRKMLATFRWYWDPREDDVYLTRDALLDVLGAVGQAPEPPHDSRSEQHATGGRAASLAAGPGGA